MSGGGFDTWTKRDISTAPDAKEKQVVGGGHSPLGTNSGAMGFLDYIEDEVLPEGLFGLFFSFGCCCCCCCLLSSFFS